ncbi:hypothetical protein SY83_19120 [Paenibacillus swuensis]|uniref:Uncharacterized protein n=2 Tax=Paenibacillus swuensis TaxID=1178515 RepID=A0A172TMB8_9BACL|nr:hypothetical protein SY83_19120 [Paenibacillus swuensis]
MGSPMQPVQPMPTVMPYAPMAPTTMPYMPYPQADRYSVIEDLRPAIAYGLNEAEGRGYDHTLSEVAAISYLMGLGYDYNTAYATVDSWNLN